MACKRSSVQVRYPPLDLTIRFVGKTKPGAVSSACFLLSEVCSTTDLQRESAAKMAKREPGYCLRKPTGQVYVNLGGKVVAVHFVAFA